MRKAWFRVVGAAVLLGAGGPALAFQEVEVLPAEQGATAPEAAVVPQPVPPAVQLQTKDAAPKKGDKGWSVPGLGKLDFGLELLYGQQQQPQPFQDQQQGSIADQTADDMKVLGTVRRRF
jgi:hypothetical protein